MGFDRVMEGKQGRIGVCCGLVFRLMVSPFSSLSQLAWGNGLYFQEQCQKMLFNKIDNRLK